MDAVRSQFNVIPAKAGTQAAAIRSVTDRITHGCHYFGKMLPHQKFGRIKFYTCLGPGLRRDDGILMGTLWVERREVR